jgi:hypothetical protein
LDAAVEASGNAKRSGLDACEAENETNFRSLVERALAEGIESRMRVICHAFLVAFESGSKTHLFCRFSS